MGHATAEDMMEQIEHEKASSNFYGWTQCQLEVLSSIPKAID
jgi:hypothetical protein